MRSSLAPHTQRIIEAEIARSQQKQHVNPETPKERIRMTNQLALLNVDPRRILRGEVDIYDDRERARR